MTLLTASILALSLLHFSEYAIASEELVNDQVMLFTRFNLQRPFCAGTVIADKYVLTAAHCVVDQYSNEIETNPIIVGNLTKQVLALENDKSTFNFVKEIIVHKQYVRPRLAYDIAVLRLTPGFSAELGMKTLELPPKKLYDGIFPKVTSFTSYNPADQSEEVPEHLVLGRTDLRYNKIQLQDTYACRVWMDEEFNHELQMCNAFDVWLQKLPEWQLELCDRDGGSGVVYEGKVIGLVSWSKKCNKEVKDRPTVYTKVSAFSDWIRKVMTGERDETDMRFHVNNDTAFIVLDDEW